MLEVAKVNSGIHLCTSHSLWYFYSAFITRQVVDQLVGILYYIDQSSLDSRLVVRDIPFEFDVTCEE